ncbi:MAG: hypothetical protein KAH21_01435, partial [Spirochaetaceae bacterium]|nr:hypothetical protein [Spirochaetaceae bacterium]
DGEIWRVDPENSRASLIILPDVFKDKQRFAVPEEWVGEVYVLDGQHLLVEGQLVTAYEADA